MTRYLQSHPFFIFELLPDGFGNGSSEGMASRASVGGCILERGMLATKSRNGISRFTRILGLVYCGRVYRFIGKVEIVLRGANKVFRRRKVAKAENTFRNKELGVISLRHLSPTPLLGSRSNYSIRMNCDYDVCPATCSLSTAVFLACGQAGAYQDLILLVLQLKGLTNLQVLML
jgi:hypothetical protein